MKDLQDMTSDELVSFCTTNIFDGLIKGGTKEMKIEIHLALSTAIIWQQLQDQKKKKENNG